MQTEPSTPNAADPAAPPPNEDSGLHEIRNLARSARASASSRRITVNPPIDEDVLASSSAGWKAVALPEPAKMVSLPELSELPSASEVRAKDKAARKAAVATPAASATGAPATAAPIVPITAAAKKPAARSNVARNAALAAMGVAAAAGIVIVALNTTSSGSGTSTSRAADTGLAAGQADQAPAAPPAAVKVEAVPAVTTTVPAPPAPGPSTDADPNAVAAPVGAAGSTTGVDKIDAPKGKAVVPKKQLEHKVTIEDTAKKPAAQNAKTAPQQAPDKGEKPKDQSLDDLLKDSNNGGAPSKPAAPKLDKKQLTTADITSAMGGLAGQAQHCYKGTQGTAKVRVTVSANGSVAKVSVGGVGAPEASCVEGLVRSLTFPPWDGGPQSFNYSYLLSE